MSCVKLLNYGYLLVGTFGWLARYSEDFVPLCLLGIVLALIASLVGGFCLSCVKPTRWGLAVGVLPIVGLLLCGCLGHPEALIFWMFLGIPFQALVSARLFGLPMSPKQIAATMFAACGCIAPVEPLAEYGVPMMAVITLGMGILVALLVPRDPSTSPALSGLRI